MLFSSRVAVALGCTYGVANSAILAAHDASKPSLPHDPSTTSYCTRWINVANSQACDQIISDNFIDLATLRRWNPSLTAQCSLTVGRSYCIEAFDESLKARSTTTTAPGNSIQTPTPIQPGMVNNCDQFYWVKQGETCSLISTVHGIKLSMFLEWNPQAGSSCNGLLTNTYACVSIIGVSGQPAPDFPERVLDKVRSAERTIGIMGPDVNNLVLQASGAWSGRYKEAADTFTWFHPITNNQLTQATSVYVSSLLTGPRPSVKRRRVEGTQLWEKAWMGADDNVGKHAAIHARDLYDDVLIKCKASLNTWTIMRPDVLNTANEAGAWWTGQPKELSKTFASSWETGTYEQVALLKWLISTLENYGRP